MPKLRENDDAKNSVFLHKIHDQACKWTVENELKILKIEIKEEDFKIHERYIPNSPYILPKVTRKMFNKDEPVAEISNNQSVQSFYEDLKKLSKGDDKSLLENKVIKPMMHSLIENLQLRGGSIWASEPRQRCLDMNIDFTATKSDIEIRDNYKIYATVELKDSRNPKSENIEAQLTAAMLSLAQKLKQIKEDGSKSFEVYGITVLDYNVNFYKATVQADYLDEINKGKRPTSILQVVRSPRFSLWQLEGRTDFLKHLNFLVSEDQTEKHSDEKK